MVIYVDIDETICDHPPPLDGETRDYTKAIPIQNNIDKINSLYNSGDTIIYWTARGATTGIDWGDLTRSQIKSWGALHHDVKMGKPYYDLFICDKAMNSVEFFREDKGVK